MRSKTYNRSGRKIWYDRKHSRPKKWSSHGYPFQTFMHNFDSKISKSICGRALIFGILFRAEVWLIWLNLIEQNVVILDWIMHVYQLCNLLNLDYVSLHLDLQSYFSSFKLCFPTNPNFPYAQWDLTFPHVHPIEWIECISSLPHLKSSTIFTSHTGVQVHTFKIMLTISPKS